MKTEILEALMKDVSGASFISITTVTPVKLTGGKKNPMQDRVTKKTTGSNVMVFQNKSSNAYENMVNRRLLKEGKTTEFTVGPRPWGTRVTNTPFVVHGDQKYLEVILLKAGEVQYQVDGIDFNGVIEGLTGGADTAEQGGLDDKVIIRTIKCENVKEITVNHHKYTE